jgi:ABC-type nickel/cobalt efflux system permease component RcnA
VTAFSILAVGLLLGMQHATEADHLAAVATLVARPGSLGQTLRQGVAWGIGHSLSLLGFGGAVLLLGQAISPDLEHALETAVGAMLVLLGADLLRRASRARIHVDAHRDDAATLEGHAHRDRGEGAHAGSPHRRAQPRHWPLRALAVGMMQGLAGSAALVVLSLEAMASPRLGFGYIAVFGVGSIAGMALLSVVIALPLGASARRLAGLHRALTIAVGAASCALGAAMMIEIGYLSALLA